MFEYPPLPFDLRLALFWGRWGVEPWDLTGVQRGMVESALHRGDTRTADIYMQDYRLDSTKKAAITRFQPGQHYYALGTRFDTYESALAHLTNRGYTCLGVRTTYVYARQGD